MESPILFDGKEYISASRASQKIGYASDYIGQLCRAKKIPGKLIGRTWYVDFASLVEHKKNRHYGRIETPDIEPEPIKLLKRTPYVESVWNVRLFKKTATASLVLLIVLGAGFSLKHTVPLMATELRQGIESLAQGGQLVAASISGGVDKFFDGLVAGFRGLKEIALNKIFFTPPWRVESPSPKITETTPSLPSLPPKAITEITKVFNADRIFATLTRLTDGTFTKATFDLARTPASYSVPTSATLDFLNGFLSIATEVRQRIESVQDAGKKFLTILSTDLAQNERLVAASISSGVDKFFSNIIDGFRGLKEIALNKIFFTPPRLAQSSSPKITEATPSLPSPPSKAMTEVTKVFSVDSLKSELKTELENYINIKINSARPSVVAYPSLSVATAADFKSFKVNEVIPITYNVVTRQSDSDSGRLSSVISSLTNDGTFTRATFSTICLSSDCRTSWPNGSSGDVFAWTPTSYGVSTSTTLGFLNGFLSTASSTINSNLIITGNSTTTNATTTSLAVLNLSAADCDVKALTNGSIYCGTDASGAGGNSKWATSSTDTLAISPSNALRIGIGTTTPYYGFTIASSTGPQLSLSDGAGITP